MAMRPKMIRGRRNIKNLLRRIHQICLNCRRGGCGQRWPQLGELNRGKSKHRPRNALHLYGGPYPFVQTGDIKNATGVIREYKQTYSEEGLKQSRLWPKGTLCITIAANIADTALLGFDACFPDSIVGFISESENVDIRFVEYFFSNSKGKY